MYSIMKKKLMKNKQDVKLTKFQWKVLNVTAKIPIGETKSYKWVAEQVGSPKAVRAVGQALKRNPYPVIIPCHRVICSDGKIGGYTWKGKQNPKRKISLLKKEGVKIKNNKIIPSII